METGRQTTTKMNRDALNDILLWSSLPEWCPWMFAYLVEGTFLWSLFPIGKQHRNDLGWASQCTTDLKENSIESIKRCQERERERTFLTDKMVDGQTNEGIVEEIDGAEKHHSQTEFIPHRKTSCAASWKRIERSNCWVKLAVGHGLIGLFHNNRMFRGERHTYISFVLLDTGNIPEIRYRQIMWQWTRSNPSKVQRERGGLDLILFSFFFCLQKLANGPREWISSETTPWWSM